MALIPCTECGKEISDKAKTCPNCGAKIRKRTNPSTWIVLVLLLIIASIYIFSDGTEKKTKVLSINKNQIELINKMTSEGFLRIEAEYNKAYIASEIWNKIDANGKENLSRSIAIYCGNKKGTHLYWVEIYDKISGKKIAKYSNSWGFEVY